jgi:hypothetical protein
MKTATNIQVSILLLLLSGGVASCFPFTHLIPPPRIEYTLQTIDRANYLQFDLRATKVDEKNPELTLTISNTGVDEFVFEKAELVCNISGIEKLARIHIEEEERVLFPGELRELKINVSDCSRGSSSQFELRWYFKKNNLEKMSVCKINKEKIVHPLWNESENNETD